MKWVALWSVRERHLVPERRLYPNVIKEIQTTVFMDTEWPIDVRALRGLRAVQFSPKLFAMGDRLGK